MWHTPVPPIAQFPICVTSHLRWEGAEYKTNNDEKSKVERENLGNFEKCVVL